MIRIGELYNRLCHFQFFDPRVFFRKGQRVVEISTGIPGLLCMLTLLSVAFPTRISPAAYP
jgi:hypothetical protein